jgi:hypothetical protein
MATMGRQEAGMGVTLDAAPRSGMIPVTPSADSRTNDAAVSNRLGTRAEGGASLVMAVSS